MFIPHAPARRVAAALTGTLFLLACAVPAGARPVDPTPTSPGLRPVVTADADAPAQEPAQVPAPEPAPAEKVTSTLERTFEQKERSDFWVRLSDRPDLGAAKDVTGWAERGRYVYDTLRENARAAQAGVIDQLEADGVDYTAYWISNSILVRDGSAGLASRLARRDDVGLVHQNLPVELVASPERSTTASAEPGAEPSVEPSAEPEAAEPAAPGIAWNLQEVKAPEVWELGYTGEGITVASFDTGVDATHPALREKYRGYDPATGEQEDDYNWSDLPGACESGPCDPDHGHGTHTTGTMVGGEVNGTRIGVAPDAEWIATNAVDMAYTEPGCDPRTDRCVADWAAYLANAQWLLAPTRADGSDPDPARRPHIINNSWGIPAGAQHEVPPDYLSEEVDAWEAAGIFGVWAAGNEGQFDCQSLRVPARHPATYAVGAYSQDGTIWYASARGAGDDDEVKPNIAAPGDGILSAVPAELLADQHRDFDWWSGTSMAAPHVAGAVALLWDAAPSLIGDVEATRRLLDATAVDTEDLSCQGTPQDNNVWGEGKLDVLALVESAPTVGSGTVVGTVTDADGAPVAGAQVTVAGGGSVGGDSVGGDSVVHVVTGRDGTYSTHRLPGEHHVTVSGFGYYPSGPAVVEVHEGRSAVADAVLVPAPPVEVSGRVVDGSGHGWPLDARVSVAGTPVRTTTDPLTGEFALSLPAGTEYTLNVRPFQDGYRSTVDTVTVGETAVEHDVAVPVDAPVCAADGYAFTGGTPLEPFDGDAAPDGWTVTDDAGSGVVWEFGEPGGLGNTTGGGGGAAQADGGGADGVVDTSLVSPVVDLSAVADPVLRFRQTFWPVRQGDTASVELSTDGGDTWTRVLHQAGMGSTGAVERLRLPDAAGQAEVRVRFAYRTPVRANLWQLDDVEIGGCAPRDGGLVVGTVTDRNTSDPFDGATVTVRDAPDATTETRTSERSGAGSYRLFSPATGEQTVEFAAEGFVTQEIPVSVVPHDVVRRDVSLPAGMVTVSKDRIDASVGPGGSATADFRVTNEGTAPATVTLRPRAAGFEPLGSTGDGVAPPPAQPAAVGVGLTHSASQEIVPGLGSACPRPFGIMETSLLRTFELEDFAVDDSFTVDEVSFGVETGPRLYLYVNLYSLRGDTLTYANLDPVGSGQVWYDGTPQSVVRLPVTGTVPAGATLVVEVVLPNASWLYPGFNTAGQTAPTYFASPGCGVTEPVDFADLDVIGGFVMNVTGSVASGPSWLDVGPRTVSLDPGESVRVEAELDGDQGPDRPGTYTAEIGVRTDTPYEVEPVEARLTVAPPRDWVRLRGEVTDDDGAPIDGAQVRLQGDGLPRRLILDTAADGTYEHWIEPSARRVDLTATATGHITEHRTVATRRGTTVTTDFELVRVRVPGASVR